MNETHHHAILGCLLGTAVGDALGLPAEGLSRRRIAARWGRLEDHRLVLGRGLISDDTEHTLMVATALIEHRSSVEAFQRGLTWRFRWWFASLPAGVGLSTAKAILKLWMGMPPSRSGVRSAGNGAAMRSAIIGVVWQHDEAALRRFTEAAATLTHIDPRAVEAALMIARAAALAARRVETLQVVAILRELAQSAEMIERVEALTVGLARGDTVTGFAERWGGGRGVSGFAPDSCAVALYAWLRHRGDFRETLVNAIACGGDTDSVAAMAGGLAGAETGEDGIPPAWITNLWEWPRSTAYLRQVAAQLAQDNGTAPSWCWLAIPLRNAVFLSIVLAHGFRRLLPPY